MFRLLASLFHESVREPYHYILLSLSMVSIIYHLFVWSRRRQSGSFSWSNDASGQGHVLSVQRTPSGAGSYDGLSPSTPQLEALAGHYNSFQVWPLECSVAALKQLIHKLGMMHICSAAMPVLADGPAVRMASCEAHSG